MLTSFSYTVFYLLNVLLASISIFVTCVIDGRRIENKYSSLKFTVRDYIKWWKMDVEEDGFCTLFLICASIGFLPMIMIMLSWIILSSVPFHVLGVLLGLGAFAGLSYIVFKIYGEEE